MTIRMLHQKIFQPIVSGSFLSLAKVGKCNALWSDAAAAVSVVGLVSYFLKFNGITGVSQFMEKQMVVTNRNFDFNFNELALQQGWGNSYHC